MLKGAFKMRLKGTEQAEFNRWSEYTLHMGNVTSSNIINATDIAELMS